MMFIGSMALLSFHIVGSIVVWRAAIIEQPRPIPAVAPIEVPA